MSHVVLDELKDRLLDGRYAAGSRISIQEVKNEFGVSKQPVMDAMRRLEAIGIVQIVPLSGCCVALYTVREIQDFFNLLGRFEGEIAAAAAERRTDAQLAELDAVWQRIANLEAANDPARRSRGYRSLNREFHLVIHQMAHSRVMAELNGRMWDMSDFFISTIGGSQHSPTLSATATTTTTSSAAPSGHTASRSPASRRSHTSSRPSTCSTTPSTSPPDLTHAAAHRADR